MENKPKTYWQEIIPLWKNALTFFIPFPTWGQAVTLLFIAIAPILFIFWVGGNSEELVGNVINETTRWWLGLGWLVFLLLPTFIGANINLYKNQIEKRREFGEFIKNPFGVEVYKSNRPPQRGETVRVSLKIQNMMPNKQISECHVRLDDVFCIKGKPIVHEPQNLYWNARENPKREYGNWSVPIAAGDYRICDVAVSPVSNNNVHFLTWMSDIVKEYVEPGEYILSF